MPITIYVPIETNRGVKRTSCVGTLRTSSRPHYGQDTTIPDRNRLFLYLDESKHEFANTTWHQQ